MALSAGLPFSGKEIHSWVEMRRASKTYDLREKKITTHVTMICDEMKTAPHGLKMKISKRDNH